jgi:hypothetical protein
MNRWSLRQVFVLLLAVFVTAGIGLSVVRANDMALKMAMPSDMGAATNDDCKNCPDGLGKSGAKAMACAAVCVAPVMAHHPEAPLAIMAPAAAIYPAAAGVLYGRALRPDPHPPRTSDIA